MEQGRAANPSASVLSALADVLDLDRTERMYLSRVAELKELPFDQPLTVPVPVQELMRTLGDHVPTFVLNPATDIVAWNQAGEAVFEGQAGRQPHNVARSLFLNPAMSTWYGNWESVARDQVAWLRYDLVTHLGDGDLISLVEELLEYSPKFARLWKLHEVRRRSHGRRVINHSTVGELDMYYTALPLPADPRLTIISWSAPSGSPSADRIHRLVAENRCPEIGFASAVVSEVVSERAPASVVEAAERLLE